MKNQKEKENTKMSFGTKLRLEWIIKYPYIVFPNISK